MIEEEELIVISDDLSQECVEVLEEYKTQEGKSFNGVDVFYIVAGREMSRTLDSKNIRLIFITSDRKLYNAARAEVGFDTFHFWSCDYGCNHVVKIPDKEDKDAEKQTVKCPNCDNQVVVKEQYISSNTCSECSKHCEYCTIEECSSTYTVDFHSLP